MTSSSKPITRAVNWDILRTLAMFLVIVTHAAYRLGPIGGVETGNGICAAVIICDPLFFALSGYFAIRPLKRSLKDYYLNKVATIILPLFVYSIVLYLYNAILKEEAFFIGNYIEFFANQLSNAWWFIPALIPCLIAAPFIAKGFEALSDKQLIVLGGIIAGLFAWGAVFSFLKWGSTQLGIESLQSLCSVALYLVPSSLLTRGPQFFMFFIMGGIFLRVAPLITRKAGNWLIAGGCTCWIVDIAFAACGIPRNDPSFFWLFTTIGIMVLCDRLSVRSRAAKTAITWAAMRSYSIYLLNLEALYISGVLFYDWAIFGNIADMAATARILMWAFMLFFTYAVALAGASIVDPLLLRPAQRLFRRLAMRPRETQKPNAKGARSKANRND